MNKVLIIAEAGVNHNGSIILAKQLIDIAAESGADIVKFQTFKSDRLVTKNAEKASYQKENTESSNEDNSQLSMLKKLELNEADHKELIRHCEEKNIRFLSTPFDHESIELLHSLNIKLFKIPSGEITNLPYLKKIAAIADEIILSTGMSTLDEIQDALNVFSASGFPSEKITVLHCNTEYPTPFEDVNLKAMLQIKDTFGMNIGYSDHTKGIEVAIAAVALGATVIEKHFTIDRNMEGPDHKASLEPNELKQMVSSIRNIELALGNGLKAPSPSELKNKKIARKSIHIKHDLVSGHVLTENELVMKRPGNGISPMEYEKVIGKKLIKSVTADHMLKWEELI